MNKLRDMVVGHVLPQGTLRLRILRAALYLLVLLLGFGSAAVVGYSLGWTHRGNAEAEDRLALEERKNNELRMQVERNVEIATLYAAEKAKQKTVYRTIRQEVPHVVTSYVARPGPAALPAADWVVTRDFVRVWNAGLTGELPAPAGRSAGAAAAADPSDDQRAGVGATDILTNHIDNAEQYLACRSQLQTLIDWHRQSR